MNIFEKISRKKSRAVRVHNVTKASGRMRLLVHRSNNTIYAQIVDITGKVICSTSGLQSKLKGIAMAGEVGKNIAELALKSKVKEVAFDRNGYKYHGKVKSLADAARKAGLSF